MTAARSPERMSYEDFLRMEETSELRHEWVDGVVYAMTRATPTHGRLVSRVSFILERIARGDCTPFASNTPIFIEAAKHHTYADASLVCGPLVTRTVKDKNQKNIGEAITNPCLIVEVLSESTERYDRDGKFEAYKRLPSFAEYVLVSQDEERIEVRTREGDRWTARIGEPGETVRVHGQEVAVEEFYRRV